MDTKSQRDIARKLKILNYALDHKNVAKTCRHFSIGRARFYRWKTAYLLKLMLSFYSLSMNQGSVLSAFNIQPLMIQPVYAHLKSTKSIRRLMPWILSITL